MKWLKQLRIRRLLVQLAGLNAEMNEYRACGIGNGYTAAMIGKVKEKLKQLGHKGE